MPRRDGTGPAGQGPMTGRGMGVATGTSPAQMATGASPQEEYAGEVSIDQVMTALEEAMQMSTDQNRFVDVNQLVQNWPQVAQKYGLNISIDVLLAMIMKDPQVLIDSIVRMGLAGIVMDGQQMGPEQLMQMAQQQGAPAASAPPMGLTGGQPGIPSGGGGINAA